jgi:hypothetical protein
MFLTPLLSQLADDGVLYFWPPHGEALFNMIKQKRLMAEGFS